jgi:hypothetical protein
VAVYYPRQGFAKYLGNDKAMLDYLALIKTLEARITALEDDLTNATGFLQVPGGDFFLTPGGDRLALPGA